MIPTYAGLAATLTAGQAATLADSLTPTRLTGIAAYTLAAACCCIAWAQSRATPAVAKLAASLAAIESLLLLDMLFNIRWQLHETLADAAQRRHEYDLRRLPQTILIAALVAVLLLGLAYALRLYRTRVGALLAVSGAMLSLISWCVEVVSLHAVDALLYRPIGRCMAVAFLWMLACLLTSAGILIESRRSRAAS
jgi:hypothetical protein